MHFKRVFLRSLVLAAMASLCATSAHAIHINQQAFVANGGNLQDIPGTAANVFDQLRTASLATQFLGVGNLAGCTGTWLGTEGNHAWVLTAAHCVPTTTEERDIGHLTFRDAENRPLAGGAGSRAYVHPYRINPPPGMSEAATDIALLRMPLLPAAFTTTLPATPLINDRPVGIGTTVSMVGHGTAGVASTPIDAYWPTQGVRRVWGESQIDRMQESDRVVVSNFSPLQGATNWARAGVGDGGAAWWQEHGGEWTVVATTNGGHATATTGAVAAPYASWLTSRFPGVRLVSERFRVTATKRFVSLNLAAQASRGQVYYVVAPNQPGVTGPTSGIWVGRVPAYTQLSLTTADAATGATRTIKLRAQRAQSCNMLAMNDATGCEHLREGALHMWFDPNDNPTLPPGAHRGTIVVHAKGWHDHAFFREIKLDIAIDTFAQQGRVTRTQKYVSPNHALDVSDGTVYYLIAPNQAGVVGPTARRWTGVRMHSVITVPVVDASKRTTQSVNLRARRTTSRCGNFRMEDAIPCYTMLREGPLEVWFDKVDNPLLPAGLHRGAVHIDAHGWHVPFKRGIKLDVEIDTR
jgi:hypothetical protein